MSNPIRQHYIPKSYLKNFGIQAKRSTILVDVHRIKEDILLEKVSISDICVQKNLYTLHDKKDEEKYALEVFYAENVDSEFPKVYEMLIDKKKQSLTPEEKYKVLNVCLSLYFRTPKYLNAANKVSDDIFDTAALTADAKSGLIKMELFGEPLEFHLDELDNYKKSYHLENQKRFHRNHLESWHNFTKYKFECNVNVIHVPDNTASLITCDNPVTIRGFKTNVFVGLFNPDNLITFPLDPNHFLEIHPNRMSDQSLMINRLEHDADFVFTTNAMTESNAVDQLIGKPGTIEKHFKLQEFYENPENAKRFEEKAKNRALKLSELLQLVNKYGFPSLQTIQKLKEMAADPDYKNDKQIEAMINRIKDTGNWH